MNRKVFIFLICLFAISKDYAQVKKVYAYKQASIPGNIVANDKNEMQENNGTKQKKDRRQNFNYWFYLSIPKKEKVTITGLWIDDKQFEIKLDTITDLPVRKIIYTGLQKNDTVIMAPVTSNKIVLVYPGPVRNNNSKYALNLARTNELVIRYIWKHKTYYTSIKKIKELIPDVRV